jgi:hypothetical protein
MMTWVDWFKIGVFLFAVCVLLSAAVVGVFWLCLKPMGGAQPQRMVDVHNRGRTRLLMPDGTIK